MNESKKMALLAVEALEDKKAEDITIIDISEVSVLADYFIIADGSNRIRYRLWLTVQKKHLAEQDMMQSRLKDTRVQTGFLWITRISLFMYSVKKIVLSMIWKESGEMENRLVKKIYSRIKKSSQDRYFCRVDVLGTLFLLLPLYNISDYEEEVMKFIVLLKYAI